MESDEWIEPVRRVWQGIQFDSQLEADWAASLTMWKTEWQFHPGSLDLGDGRRWEPDFYLPGCDALLEVKGAHDHRIDKPWLAAEKYDKLVVVGRAGFVAPDWETEFAGAVWQPSDVELVPSVNGLRFVRGEGVYKSADVVYGTPMSGIRMFKAVGEAGIV